jgi:hypothetical protein
MSAGRHTVHVRVNDAATGQPTPVRLRITNPAGEYFAPFGRLTEFATGRNQDVGCNLLLGRKRYAYIDGSCEVRLPAGRLLVEVSKGPEYLPLVKEVDLVPGKLALRFAVERWTDLRSGHWFSGDTRCHFLTPHAALLEAAAEDLAVVNLLATETRIADRSQKEFPAIPNIAAFSGQQPALERPGHRVVVNTLNTHPELGSLGLLNCHRVVYPLTFGGPGGWDNWTLADWCDQCHRKGGLVVWARAWHECATFPYGEPLADLILGKVDAFEIDFFEDSPFDVLPDWYALLKGGCRVPLVGASGKDSNGVALGCLRTYARLQDGEECTYRNWIEAIRAGRTFVTNGPLLDLAVNGQPPGTALALTSGDEAVRVRAEAKSIVPFEQLEVLANGEVVASAGASGSPATATLETELPLPEGGWLAARCRGTQQLPHRHAYQRVFAHTSPVYVLVTGRPQVADVVAIRKWVGALDQMLDWAHHKAHCENEKQRQDLLGIFQSAKQVLESRVGS